ncbi:MAG: hypothetical protein AAGU32_00670, partial [Bacillota bacterium]
LLRVIAGLEAPNSGNIYFDGECVFSYQKSIRGVSCGCGSLSAARPQRGWHEGRTNLADVPQIKCD